MGIDKQEKTSISTVSSSQSLYQEVEMQVNHVVTLKPVNEFTSKDKLVHFTHNRVLQTGFHSGDPQDLVNIIQRNHSKNTNPEVWLTDFIQPTPKAALSLNIVAELITTYQVPVEYYQSTMEQVYHELLKKDEQFEANCLKKIDNELRTAEEIIVKEQQKLYDQWVNNMPDSAPCDLVRLCQDARILAEYSVGKNVTNKVVEHYIADKMSTVMAQLRVEKKPTRIVGTNHDIAVLGAAGSGKSYLMHSNMPHLIKKERITISTDDYRGVYLPEQNDHEHVQTEQVFTRTQDTAYLIKELILSRLEKLTLAHHRADLLFDGITFERSLNKLIEPSKQNFQTVVACLSDSRDAPTRAYNRALRSADPADKGRFINTSSLISGHRESSGRAFIDAVPDNASKTEFINTDGSPGKPPQLFGSIIHETNSNGHVVANLRIYNIKTACDYFGKQNLNPRAHTRQELFSLRENPVDRFRYTNYHKARSLLSLVSSFEPTAQWKKINNLEFGEPPFVRFKLTQDPRSKSNTFEIEVLDETRYQHVLNVKEKSPEAILFIEIVTQAKMYNKMQTNQPFTEQSVNQSILQERYVLGVKNLVKEHVRPNLQAK